MSPFLILHNDLRKNNGRSNMTYGRWHCGKTLALNQTHSGMFIWRNGPYIGGHLAFFFQIEFETLL